jgi:hypothetical protein
MGIYTQSQQLKFFFNPAQIGGNTSVKMYRWGNLCTIDLLQKDPARLIKLSAFASVPDFDGIVGTQSMRQLAINNWTASGRWRSPTREYYFLNTCQFNCPLNFAALSVFTQENWFLTSENNIYTRECFFMGGFTIENVTMSWADFVDITPVPNPPFADRLLTVDIRFTIEYEL